MAHDVRARLNTKVVAHKDLEIVVKSSRAGKLGTLLVSRGNIEWLPKGASVNKRRFTWTEFANLMRDQGKPAKIRRPRSG